MEVLTAQFCTIAIFFCSMLACCLLPMKLVPRSGGSAFEGTGYTLVVSLANCLSAGVFLATFFVGLLPEVRQEFQVILNEKRIITELPVTEFVVFLGFFLAVFVEQLLLTCKRRMEANNNNNSKKCPGLFEKTRQQQQKKQHQSSPYASLPSSDPCHDSQSSLKSEHERRSETTIQRSMYTRSPTSSSAKDSALITAAADSSLVLLTPENPTTTSPHSPTHHEADHRGNGYHSNGGDARHSVLHGDGSGGGVDNDEDHHQHVYHHHPHHEHHEQQQQHHHHGHSHDLNTAINPDSGVRVGLLLLSLGVHSVFEGMTLGLQTHLRELFNLFIGVLIHECLVAFAIGVSIAKMNVKFVLTLQLAVLFSISLPIGQVIGIVIGNNQSLTNATVTAVLQAIAAGTFIQVTFLEVIPEGLENEDKKLLKIFFLVLGFAIIAAIPAFADIHDHKQDLHQGEFRHLLQLKQNLTKW